MKRAVLLAAAAALAACSPATPPAEWQGYAEGEYVAVAAPQAGRLVALAVAAGQRVARDAPLFELEAVEAAAQRRQAEAQLRAAEAQAADLGLARRPQEAAVVRAQLAQARSEAQRSETAARRDEAQWRAGGLAEAQAEASTAAARGSAARVRELQAQLDLARAPTGREAQRRALAAQAQAASAALDAADWRLAQSQGRALQAGLVTDTLYRVGEWVPAGQPVVRLLPPGAVKARFFVPQAALAQLRPGRAVVLHCDGCAQPVAATVSFVSPQAEYTPPVIYSNDTRSKLVFLVEARPAAADGAGLQPGQPLTVRLR